MTWNEAASGSSGMFENGFGWGGALLVFGMVVALAIVSGLGILARLRDRASERRAGEPIAVETPVAAQVDHLPGDTAAAG